MAKSKDDAVGQLLQEIFTNRDGLKRLLEELVNQTMQQEVGEHLGAGRHERAESRRGYRNGSKPRRLRTRVDELELSIPQARGCEPYHPSMFAHWQRSERALLVACAEMYFQGVAAGVHQRSYVHVRVGQIVQPLVVGQVVRVAVFVAKDGCVYVAQRPDLLILRLERLRGLRPCNNPARMIIALTSASALTACRLP